MQTLPVELVANILSKRLNEEFEVCLYVCCSSPSHGWCPLTWTRADMPFVDFLLSSQYRAAALILGCVSREFNLEVRRIIKRHLKFFEILFEDGKLKFFEHPTIHISGQVVTEFAIVQETFLDLQESLKRLVVTDDPYNFN